MTRHAFICDAVRTPFGRYGGALASVRADCFSCAASATGPITVPARRASPTTSVVFSLATIASTKRSWMPAVTIKRELVLQRWPVEK
jgi:hypothetical protein